MNNGKVYLSASKISTYQQCPRKYKWQYIDRIPAPQPSFFILGTAMHSGIEYLHRGKTLAEALQEAVGRAEAETSNEYDHAMTPDEIKETACKLITVYAEQSTPLEIVKVEDEFKIEGENVILTGTLDAVERVHSEVLAPLGVVELKSAKRAWTQAQVDLQLQASVYAYSLAFPNKITVPIEVIYRIIVKPTKKDPNGRLQELRTIRKPVHYAHLTGTIQQLGKAIQQEIFPRHISPACAWCQFRKPCLGDALPDYAKNGNEDE